MVSEIAVGSNYLVKWAGEEFEVRVRGHGTAAPDTWICSRLDTNRPIVLVAHAFQEQLRRSRPVTFDRYERWNG